MVLCSCLLGCSLCQAQSQAPGDSPGTVVPQPTTAEQAAAEGSKTEQAPQAYTLSPAREAQAVAYARARRTLYFLNFACGIVVLLLLLRYRVAPRFRDWAEQASGRRFLQALVFVPLLLFTLVVLKLPGGVAGHRLQRRFGLSIQGWGSWLWDEVKGDLLTVAAAIFLVWMLYAVIRRSPRRWWLYVWLASLPVIVFLVFLSPLVVDPLFFRFTPLAQSNPELAAQLERVVAHAGQQIPESRMVLMDASEKLNAVNAYVTGLGASRRVVVWDTMVSRMNTPEILSVFGHELGHHALGHIFQGMVFAAGLLLAALFLGFHANRWAMRRYGRAWGLRGVEDWASLPLLFLLLSVFNFAFTPASNAFSRHLEHQADQYGLEVVHGIVPDAPAVAARSFQILGEVDLAEPSPSWLVQVWFYSHPPISERMMFAQTYDPWGKGESPRFVK
jgi:Zn-dependent protease with chaperone function